jgi:beta-glucosidase-like glycosyl hydrolase/CubicO group peptidase (beta-lactamase class C family)
MKNYILKISSYITILLLVSNCASHKTKKDAALKNSSSYSAKKTAASTLFFKDTDVEKHWVDSIYNKISLEEKVGQLFMVRSYSNKDSTHVNEIDQLVRDYKIGGVFFMQGGPVRQVRLNNRFQAAAKIPLFIATDAEWGLAMRLDSTYRYPWNMTLGAIKDLKLLEKIGENMAKECIRMGIQFNSAPVIDVNTNPQNPVIGNRSFGEDKIEVTRSATALMTGFQNQGVFSTAKHFPGHGDTATDSHLTLPTVTASKKRLNSVELYPYKSMINHGLASIMVAHLNVPSIEPVSGTPSSLSYKVVTELLQKKLGFQGLIITDALNMKGASNFKQPGDIDLAAFLAGNDLLLFPENVPLAIEKIVAAYQDKRISEERLAFSVKKILRYKYKAGLNKYKTIETANLLQDLNPASNTALHYQLYENAVTVLQNKNEILPIKNLNQKIAYVKLGDDDNTPFVTTLKKYTEVTEVAHTNIDSLNKELKKYNTVIVGYHKPDKVYGKPDFSETELFFLQEIAKNNTVILDIFTKPYALLQLPNFDTIEGLVVSYQNSDISQEVSAQLLFGAIAAKGKLPVSINKSFKVNAGLSTQKLNRLGFTAPENVGMNTETLKTIDSVAQKAIDDKITPGIQLLVARKGKVIYQKSYGYLSYQNEKKVANTDLYDVASITKMIATLPNVMQQYDQKKITFDTKLADMVPFLKDSNKKDINFRDLMLHHAGLVAFIPFYKKTLDSSTMPSEKYYRKNFDPQFSKRVSKNLYIRNDYHDTIMKIITDSPLSPKKEYKYSDLTFMLLKEYLENSTKKKIDVLAQENFYNSIGMNNTGFNPLQKHSSNTIASTEIDNYFRHDTIQGFVHDQGAAIEGGIAGHAGIFSNTMDIAKMMQLFLQKGDYGNQRYFSEKTFDLFNSCYLCDQGVHRGLGFDKNVSCQCASAASFGHTGFTGNIAWVDPETEIVYVFLSNRTYPEVIPGENKLLKEKIREKIQKIINESILL